MVLFPPNCFEKYISKILTTKKQRPGLLFLLLLRTRLAFFVRDFHFGALFAVQLVFRRQGRVDSIVVLFALLASDRFVVLALLAIVLRAVFVRHCRFRGSVVVAG